MEKCLTNPDPQEGTSGELTYHLKIHLLGISPQIFRRLAVRADTTLAQLHHILQVVMGWENWHLHSFHIWGKQYGIRYGGFYFADDATQVRLGDFPWRCERQVHLGVFLSMGQRITLRKFGIPFH